MQNIGCSRAWKSLEGPQTRFGCFQVVAWRCLAHGSGRDHWVQVHPRTRLRSRASYQSFPSFSKEKHLPRSRAFNVMRVLSPDFILGRGVQKRHMGAAKPGSRTFQPLPSLASLLLCMGRSVSVSRPGNPRRDNAQRHPGAIQPKCYTEEAFDDLAHRGCDMPASVHFTFILDISRPILKHRGSARFWYSIKFENQRFSATERSQKPTHLELSVQEMACHYRPCGYAEQAVDASKLGRAWGETGCSSK